MNKMLILGSGQLGLMMAEVAVKYSMVVDRFDLQTNELIYSASNHRVSASLEAVLNEYDVISAELEHLPNNPVLQKIKASEKWINAKAFEILPARDTQKQFLDDLQVANAPWRKLDDLGQLPLMFNQFGRKIVFKTTRGGYDGKGQWVISQEECDQLPHDQLGHIIAEKQIDFDYEVSLIGARDSKGGYYFYPLTRNYHDQGILRFSVAPCSDANLEETAQSYLKKIMDGLGYIGTMGMECFVVGDKLYVNEIAPRVHNSGHWTQIGATYNQFDLHVRALSGMSLPVKQKITPSVMLNLIAHEYTPDWWQLDEVDVHWYGKTLRNGRKLGHINFYTDWCRDKENQQKVLSLLDETHKHYFVMAMQDCL